MIDRRRWTKQLTQMRMRLETAGRGCLLVVATTERNLEEGLADVLTEAMNGQALSWTFDPAYPSLAAYLETLPPDGPRVVLAHGLDDLTQEARARSITSTGSEKRWPAPAGPSSSLFGRRRFMTLPFRPAIFGPGAPAFLSSRPRRMNRSGRRRWPHSASASRPPWRPSVAAIWNPSSPHTAGWTSGD